MVMEAIRFSTVFNGSSHQREILFTMQAHPRALRKVYFRGVCMWRSLCNHKSQNLNDIFPFSTHTHTKCCRAVYGNEIHRKYNERRSEKKMEEKVVDGGKVIQKKAKQATNKHATHTATQLRFYK